MKPSELSDVVIDVPGRFHGPMAWRGDSIAEEDWLSPIPDDCLAELERSLQMLRHEEMPILALDPSEYPLNACAELMRESRDRLDNGCGVVVLDRLPVERYSLDETKAVFWLLGSLLGRPVSQSIQGELMVDVRDTGIKKAIGVRGFRTNAPQFAHTDNSFNRCPPDSVSLLSVRKAASGGISKFISFQTVHNEMMKRHPALLPRLYRPFLHDRQGDFREGEPQQVSHPIFLYQQGELRSRYGHFTVPAGYESAGMPFEGEDRAAFEAVTEVVEDAALYCSFVIQPGQLQMVNNRSVGHGRGEYEDSPDPGKRRHLLRLWHRDWGRRSYSG